MMRAQKSTYKAAFGSLLLATSLFLSMSTPSFAADTPVQTPHVEKHTKTLSKSLKLSIDKSDIVEIEEPAATVFIANPDIADVQIVTPTRIMVFGKKAGETTLIINAESGGLLAQRSILVEPNLNELRKTLRELSPQGNIDVKAVPGGLILTGDVADAAMIETARRLAARYVPKEDGDIINRLKVNANNQIQIRVRFAEVSRDVDKRFGIDWETFGNMGNFAVGLATGADFYSSTAGITRTVVGDSMNDSLYTGFSNKHFSINGMLDALIQDGLVTILAEPSLTAMSGETASFLAGGEFPVPIPQSGDTITIEWKQYGVSLAFTPTIIGKDRINLHVRPEVSQLSSVGAITLSNIEVPALTTRRAETTLELNSGQSFALAGLLSNQQSQSVDKFPFLGDIPVLGPLFRSSRFQNNESELVIIITPYIVKPSTQEQLALPTDGYSTPSDEDMFLKLRQTNSDPNARTISGTARAVKVENIDIAPAEQTPSSAPLLPVEKTSKPQLPQGPVATPAPTKAAPLPMSRPVTKKTKKPALAAPSGPSGFIME